VTVPDRCAARSEAAGETIGGTASTFRRWLLVESAGPWGRRGLLDARLPDAVGAGLHRLGRRTGARVLLVRRVDRAPAVDGAVSVFAADTRADGPWLGRAVLDRIDDAVALDPGDRGAFEPVDGPLAAVCTHGRRDACCAERGRPLALALAATEPDVTWESTHVGGDRFAANLVAFPHGLVFGRVEPDRGASVVAAYRAGRIELDRFRGRTSFPTYAQAAEIDVRRALGLDGVDALRLERARRDGDLAHVLFATPSGRVAVTERRVEGPPMRLTCGHDHEEAPVAWRLEGLDAAG
jgi:hypothetical protein